MSAPLAGKAGTVARPRGWRVATAAFAIAVLILLIAYWPAARSLAWVWAHDGTYQYGFLIFPISAWLAFGLRHRVAGKAPQPSFWGLAPVIALLGVWYTGQLLEINLARHVAFVAMFPALVLACWGWRALRVLQFPLAYLVVFAVPWGDGLVGPLQDITARIAVHALDWTGVPVLLNGREILTPSAEWMVEQACSGVKFFIACTALGCLYAYLMYQRRWKRVLFVLLAAVVPVIANGLRVYCTVLIGEYFGLQYATGTDHLIFGWQFFGTVLVLLLLGGWYFRDRPVVPVRPPANGTLPAPARRLVWLAVVVLLAATPPLALRMTPAVTPARLTLEAPILRGWSAPQAGNGVWQPRFAGAAGALQREYAMPDGSAVALYHAVYTGRPRAGHSLITYGNEVYDPARARLLATADRTLMLAGGKTATARELRLTEATGERLVWYWYCVDQRCTRSPVWVKLLQAWSVLRGHAPHSSVWALSAPTSHAREAQTRAHLRAFAAALPAARP